MSAGVGGFHPGGQVPEGDELALLCTEFAAIRQRIELTEIRLNRAQRRLQRLHNRIDNGSHNDQLRAAIRDEINTWWNSEAPTDGPRQRRDRAEAARLLRGFLNDYEPAASTAVGNETQLQHVDGVDQSGDSDSNSLRPASPGLTDPGELVDQPAGDHTPTTEISTPESGVEGLEVRDLPPDTLAALGVIFGHHHNLPTLHGLVTRYGTGVSALRRWLQRRQWVRRAVPAVRPSDTTTGGDAA